MDSTKKVLSSYILNFNIQLEKNTPQMLEYNIYGVFFQFIGSKKTKLTYIYYISDPKGSDPLGSFGRTSNDNFKIHNNVFSVFYMFFDWKYNI